MPAPNGLPEVPSWTRRSFVTLDVAVRLAVKNERQVYVEKVDHE
jgi:hypothetical protein